MTRLALAGVMFAAAALMFGGSAWAAELAMFEEPGCDAELSPELTWSTLTFSKVTRPLP